MHGRVSTKISRLLRELSGPQPSRSHWAADTVYEPRISVVNPADPFTRELPKLLNYENWEGLEPRPLQASLPSYLCPIVEIRGRAPHGRASDIEEQNSVEA